MISQSLWRTCFITNFSSIVSYTKQKIYENNRHHWRGRNLLITEQCISCGCCNMIYWHEETSQLQNNIGKKVVFSSVVHWVGKSHFRKYKKMNIKRSILNSMTHIPSFMFIFYDSVYKFLSFSIIIWVFI